jgi:hypothetical protein
MVGIAHESGLAIGRYRPAMPSVSVRRLRNALLRHSDVILRIALMCGAFVGYALSELVR